MAKTRILKVDTAKPDEASLREAAEIIKNGGLVIMPTDTVYGIGANMYDNKAMKRLCEIKNRPHDKPFSLHIDRKEKVDVFAADIPIAAYQLIDRFWPGPLTLILKCKDERLLMNPKGAKHPFTIGIRMPDNEIALDLIDFAGVPVACPSANISGKPAPANFEDALADLNGAVECAIDSGPTKIKRESSIVDLTVDPIKVIREGAISEKNILETALTAAPAAAQVQFQEKVGYGGWRNCVRLANGKVELIVTTDVGPRVIRFGFVGGQNLLKEVKEQLGKTGGEEWRSYGGHRLWHAPEAAPRTYAPDNSPVKYSWDGKTLKLVQPVEASTGIAKEIEITLDPGQNHVTLVHRLINRNLWDVELAPWVLTVMAQGGRAIFPQEECR